MTARVCAEHVDAVTSLRSRVDLGKDQRQIRWQAQVELAHSFIAVFRKEPLMPGRLDIAKVPFQAVPHVAHAGPATIRGEREGEEQDVS